MQEIFEMIKERLIEKRKKSENNSSEFDEWGGGYETAMDEAIEMVEQAEKEFAVRMEESKN